MEKLGRDLGGAHAGQHPPGGVIAQHFPRRAEYGKADRQFFQAISRHILSCREKLLGGGLFSVLRKVRRGEKAAVTLRKREGQLRLPFGRLLGEFFTGVKNHAQRLHIIFVDIAFNVQFHLLFSFVFFSFELSITMVTGPFASMERRISAPKRPVAVGTPSRSNAATKKQYSSSAVPGAAAPK